MTTFDQKYAKELREVFKVFNKFMLLMWRLGLGGFLNRWPDVGGRIMVLTHTGRKTGLKRRTPLNYALIDDDVYCTAGFGRQAHWYRNVKANPEVEVWLPEGWWAGVAEDVSEDEDRLPKLRQVLIASGAVAPMFGIDPQTMSTEELDAATSHYRLLRIHRTVARTGPDGPGDLAWVWPVSTLALLLLLFIRPRKR